MKIIGIILVALQILSMIGSASSGALWDILSVSGVYGIGRLVGYFLPGLAGILLICLSGKKKKN